MNGPLMPSPFLLSSLSPFISDPAQLRVSPYFLVLPVPQCFYNGSTLAVKIFTKGDSMAQPGAQHITILIVNDT